MVERMIKEVYLVFDEQSKNKNVFRYRWILCRHNEVLLHGFVSILPLSWVRLYTNLLFRKRLLVDDERDKLLFIKAAPGLCNEAETSIRSNGTLQVTQSVTCRYPNHIHHWSCAVSDQWSAVQQCKGLILGVGSAQCNQRGHEIGGR